MSRFTHDKSPYGSRFVVDGQTFGHSDGVYRAALAKGFTGTSSQIKYRLARGACTWAEILKPANKAISGAMKDSYALRRAEMAELIAAMDARKAALK